ncbi:GntG family PLP-dependent aldolase [Cytophagales bacterium LB-30]|uniref:GntG family PLP-dependent aldolase n=1 Tax=Shiella aurantiaca TaxID=3058365 RepID=A0ABT8F1E4_9BACT|nr:GntG family PLP-dependent aldolase [Shiella aurantiaca]MDN4164225.1 GntG family PLP-dependent aldolase [Shiella aurantiaca]
MNLIDYRSDTVTLPTEGMKEAMMQAPLGDDVLGEDPSVKALEEYAATLFGKEAALFCPSGTMTNQIAIRLHTQPQQEVICDKRSHIYLYEGGGIAYNSFCSVKLLDGDRGRITAEMVSDAINNPNDIHFPISRLVSVENTMNKGGGAIYSLKELEKIKAVCQAHQLKFHLDGARLFNALVATGESPATHGALFDTLSICLSKGLGAPVGSLLLGTKADMQQAKRIRKVMGGGMRQAGMLAAAGLYALQHQVERLAEDHARAKLLGDCLRACAYVEDVLPIDTNIVIFSVGKRLATEVVEKLKSHGILAVAFGKHEIRLVTHLHISDEAIAQTIKTLPTLY